MLAVPSGHATLCFTLRSCFCRAGRYGAASAAAHRPERARESAGACAGRHRAAFPFTYHAHLATVLPMASRRHSYGVQRATRSTCRIVGEGSAPCSSTAHARMHALARAQECQLTAGHGPRSRARGSVRRLHVSRCKPCSMRRMCMPSHASPHVPGMGDRLQRAALGAAAVPPNLPPGGAAHPCACARATWRAPHATWRARSRVTAHVFMPRRVPAHASSYSVCALQARTFAPVVRDAAST